MRPHGKQHYGSKAKGVGLRTRRATTQAKGEEHMTREDIIRMAREAGCKPFRSPEHWDDVQVFATPNVLERFAALVAAAERESVAASSKRDLTCVCGAVWDGEQ
jgi:hypothetical protein